MEYAYAEDVTMRTGSVLNQRTLWVASVLCLISLGTPLSCVAEPTNTIQFLMKEPVSMLDWGINNIEDHLYRQRSLFLENEKLVFEPEPNLSVVYDWELNQIRLSLGLRTPKPVKRTPQVLEEVKNHVIWIIKYLRGSLTMNPYDAFFRHKGFRNKESPQNLEAELTGMTVLLIEVRDAKSNLLSRCRANLSGDYMEWGQIGDN